MKREGRQHGVVATAYLPPCNSLDQHQDGSCHRRHRQMMKQNQNQHQHQQRPTAGIFIKVSQKPTNHSKYTSRCSRPRCGCCHTFPAGKAKDKTKGSQKGRSFNVVTNHRLVTWRVADDDDDSHSRPGLKLSGSSASRILDHFDNGYDEEEDEYDGSTHDEQPQPEEIELMINPTPTPNTPRIEEIEVDSIAICGGGGGDGDGDGLSYCNVGIVWEQVNGDENEDEEEVEGWCLVQEF